MGKSRTIVVKDIKLYISTRRVQYVGTKNVNNIQIEI